MRGSIALGVLPFARLLALPGLALVAFALQRPRQRAEPAQRTIPGRKATGNHEDHAERAIPSRAKDLGATHLRPEVCSPA